MEGVTDEVYRKTLSEIFPEWNYWSTDFLRIPGTGYYKDEKVLNHFGKSVLEDEKLTAKTSYQILASPSSNTVETVRQIQALGFKHLDLNLGCPSKAVCSHKGGSFLLSDLKLLEKVIKEIRSNFDHLFTVKIRIGFNDDQNFESIIRLLNDLGAQAITLHARTRKQLYKGRANWDYIRRAVEISDVPIIGNGDIWSEEDIDRMFKEANCYAVMAARGALKTPWLSKLYSIKKQNLELDKEKKEKMRRSFIKLYYKNLDQTYENASWTADHRLRRFKGLSRYLFDDFENSSNLKSSLLRSKSLGEFQSYLGRI